MYYYYSHFGNEKTEANRCLKKGKEEQAILPKATQLVSCSREIQALQTMQQAPFQKDYPKEVASYGLGSVIISKGYLVHI